MNISGLAQENFQKVSQEELNRYLNKAQKPQKTERTFNIIAEASPGAALGTGLFGTITYSGERALIGVNMLTGYAGIAALTR